MLQQRVAVNTEVREADLRNYYLFSEIYMSRTLIPLAMAGVCIAPLMITAGGYGPYVGTGLLIIIALYAYSFFYNTRKFLQRNHWQIGQRYRISVDKRLGITVEELDLHNIEEFSWKQIKDTGENKRLFVFMFEKSAAFLPKADMPPEDVDFLQRVCLAKKGSKHRRPM